MLKSCLVTCFVLVAFGCNALQIEKHTPAWELTSAALMPFSVRDVSGKDVPYEGVATVDRRVSGYTLAFKPRNEPAEFIITTCGREKFMGVDFPRQRNPIVTYTPTLPIEGAQGLPCPLFAVSIGIRGERETAVFNVNNGDTLPIRVYCNGAWKDAKGADLCQIREGLEWGFRASEPVDYEVAERCPDLVPESGNFFRSKALAGHCTYVLLGLRSKQFFNLTVRGYQSVLEVQEGGEK